MKERIMEAVQHEVSQRGLKFSIREVAARAGISTKTLYQNFSSKEQIVARLVEASIEDMRAQEASLMQDQSLTTWEKLHHTLVNLPTGYAFYDMRSMQDLRNLYPEQWTVMDRFLKEGWDQIRLLIAQGREEGLLRKFDIDLFIDMYVGTFYYFMETKGGLTLDLAVKQTVDILMHGIGMKEGEGA
ncbi:TetR/AcrR family transcriptional regulator [Paenibacillus sp. NPDC058174]|uniref:TetR/AcrR family transcriptional regulator n=1 Tax=Paenibacillus sp. NPDC058174 TaxID=3346366 RepID=UPI0036DF13CC